MSEEQLKAFLNAVKADAGLQEKLRAAGDVDAMVAIAKAADFAVSVDELERAQSEVSDEELEGVAGGGEHIVQVGVDVPGRVVVGPVPINPIHAEGPFIS